MAHPLRPPPSRRVLVETATAAVILAIAILLVALAISDLVSVVDKQTNTASSWNKRVHSCRNRIVQAVPLTAIKIVLVAWQILTQVRGGGCLGDSSDLDGMNV